MIENKAFSDIQYYKYCLRPKRETATLIQKIFKTYIFLIRGIPESLESL